MFWKELEMLYVQCLVLGLLQGQFFLSEASLVVQWLRVHLAMQGSPVGCLVWEDPTCLEETKPMCHCY